MIKTCKHKGLKKFFETGSSVGIKAVHSKKLKIILQRLNAASCIQDMDTPGMQLHTLTGNFRGFCSVVVDKNWRVIFKFEGQDVILVDYLDYH